MITSLTNKLAEIIKKKVQEDPTLKTIEQQIERKDAIVREICAQLGEANTHRISGIMNGRYQMKLIDAVVICRFFNIERLEDLVTVETSCETKTIDQLLKMEAA